MCTYNCILTKFLEKNFSSSSFWESNTLTNVFALCSTILAFIALLASCCFSYKTFKQTAELNRKNLEVDYYREVFDPYVIERIPNVRKRIKLLSDGKLDLEPCEQMQRVLLDLLNDIYFLSYRDRDFYNKLRRIILLMDEYVVANISTIFDENKSQKYFNKIDAYLNELYSSIFNATLG